MKNYHLTKNAHGDWQLKRENAERASINFEGLNKSDAVRQSAAYLSDSGSSLKIHKGNGQFQEERTYPRSADPTKSKG
ncbi:DUF2188 domain-containing protein [Chitinophaga sp. sic0106]|uniref:DUF2188 domain-containing protein n=1 Tax=Chitinophaga sp. sic0106 TaxID=2854785 RepID=UPI001C44DF24|nr:DUF2188 domain-containing protein [Chitinophaga sp. sic0106]MBV7529272.1 DUF2188 domain-containing protein [Chitinophaga sp. sic0106]